MLEAVTQAIFSVDRSAKSSRRSTFALLFLGLSRITQRKNDLLTRRGVPALMHRIDASALNEAVADFTLENRLLKKSMLGDEENDE